MSPSDETAMTWKELVLAESRLRAVEATLANIGAPTHDDHGARLNANGRLVDWLAGRRSEGWVGPDPMREKDAEFEQLCDAIDVMNGCRLDDQEEIERLREALRTVSRNDKTVYDYHGRHATNRDGARPESGRWNTPREIARAALELVPESSSGKAA